jgi:hypothetical protein
MIETDSEPVKGIHEEIDYALDLRFLLDLVVDFASKRNWDGSAILDCKSQQKVHLLVSYNHRRHRPTPANIRQLLTEMGNFE